MMKPGIGSYDRFKEMFDQAAKKAGKQYFLIPYFIAAHPGTSDADMLQLALPSPMAVATAMYHSGVNPLRGIRRGGSEKVETVKGLRQRRLHKAFLRYHDPENWPLLRETLKRMGRADLIGSGKHQLVPSWQPAGTGKTGGEGRRMPHTARAQKFATKGVPVR
jgi:radical SAM superfamily enzyme YgiQ (UPF0313 family)